MLKAIQETSKSTMQLQVIFTQIIQVFWDDTLCRPVNMSTKHLNTCTVHLSLFFYYNQLMHNSLIKVYIKTVFCVIYTPTCFDTFVLTSGS